MNDVERSAIIALMRAMEAHLSFRPRMIDSDTEKWLDDHVARLATARTALENITGVTQMLAERATAAE